MEKMEEEKKTKKELKAEKKAEIAAVKKTKTEEKILKKSEAKAAKKAKAEERKKSKLLKNEEASKQDSVVLSEEQASVRSSSNWNRLIIVILVATIPSILVIVLYVTGVIVKDHKIARIKVTNDDFKLINSNENEVVEFEMSSFFVPLRSGNGIVKLRIALDNLRGDWKKRILMNPGRYRGVVIEAIEEDLVEDIKSREGQEAVLKKIESGFEHLLGNEVFGGIIVREFNVL